MSLFLPCTDELRLANAAEAFARACWHVVPMRPDRSSAYLKYAKEPAPSPSEARKHFQKWPDALLCIRLPENVVVLDIDVKERRLCEILAELNRRYALQHTYEVSTPSGGLHLWYQLPTGVTARNWTSDHGKFPVQGVDIRTNGGLATLPPSVRPSGAYTWKDWVPKVPKVPKKLLQDLVPPEPNRYEPRKLDFISNAGVSRYAEVALTRELERVTCSMPGSRNHNLFIASANLGSLFAAGIIPDVRRQIEQAAGICGLTKDDGLTATRSTIESGWKRGIAQPRSISAGGRNA